MLQRITHLFKAFVNLFVSDLERRNPDALLALEKENLRKQIVQYNEGLASHAALSERLMTQIKRLDSEEQDLRSKINANLQAENRDIAGQYALRLKDLSQRQRNYRDQLQEAELTYRNLVAARDQAVSAARAKIEHIKVNINNMKLQKAMADMSEMAAGMSSSLGSSGDTLSRLQQMVEEERDNAAGRARVAHDTMYMQEVSVKKIEQKALADAALDDFLAQETQALNKPADKPALTQQEVATDAEVVSPQYHTKTPPKTS